jgi:hypothetical protein
MFAGSSPNIVTMSVPLGYSGGEPGRVTPMKLPSSPAAIATNGHAATSIIAATNPYNILLMINPFS